MAAGVRCAKCGNTDDFVVVLPYKGAGLATFEGVNDLGEMVLDGLDRGDASHFYKAEIACGDCGHQWVTDRPWTMKRGDF